MNDDQRRAVADVLNRKSLTGVSVVHMPKPSIMQIRALAKRHRRKRGLPLLVIDMAGHVRSPGGSEYEQLSATSKDLAALKGELQTCVIACVQVSRAVAENADKRPELHYLKGTGSWEEDADKVLMLYRPAYYGKGDDRTEVIQAKDREHGNVGSVFIQYSKQSCRFVDAELDPRIAHAPAGRVVYNEKAEDGSND